MPGTLDAAWSRLTGAIVQLQTSIHAYRTSQQEPSNYKLLETKSTDDQVCNATEPSSVFIKHATSVTNVNLDNLESQLATFEQQLKQRNHWRIPPHFSPDPFLLIDLSDLDDAIQHLKHAIEVPRFPQQMRTPRIIFSTQRWEWDFQWSEWYYENRTSGNHVYMTEWELGDGASEWMMVAQGHKSMEEGLAELGSWEDWAWDEEWGEWYLPVILSDAAVVKRRIYASEWRRTDDGNWVYVERTRTSLGQD